MSNFALTREEAKTQALTLDRAVAMAQSWGRNDYDLGDNVQGPVTLESIISPYKIDPASRGGETVEERCERFGFKFGSRAAICDALCAAHEAGVSDLIFSQIGHAHVASPGKSVKVAVGKYQNLSRGTGWARHGRGQDVSWAKKSEAGGSDWILNKEGEWTIFSSDGFKRTSRITWEVFRLEIGGEVWTLAK